MRKWLFAIIALFVVFSSGCASQQKAADSAGIHFAFFISIHNQSVIHLLHQSKMTVLFAYNKIRFSICQRTAFDSTTRSKSRPF